MSVTLKPVESQESPGIFHRGLQTAKDGLKSVVNWVDQTQREMPAWGRALNSRDTFIAGGILGTAETIVAGVEGLSQTPELVSGVATGKIGLLGLFGDMATQIADASSTMVERVGRGEYAAAGSSAAEAVVPVVFAAEGCASLLGAISTRVVGGLAMVRGAAAAASDGGMGMVASTGAVLADGTAVAGTAAVAAAGGWPSGLGVLAVMSKAAGKGPAGTEDASGTAQSPRIKMPKVVEELSDALGLNKLAVKGMFERAFKRLNEQLEKPVEIGLDTEFVIQRGTKGHATIVIYDGIEKRTFDLSRKISEHGPHYIFAELSPRITMGEFRASDVARAQGLPDPRGFKKLVLPQATPAGITPGMQNALQAMKDAILEESPRDFYAALDSLKKLYHYRDGTAAVFELVRSSTYKRSWLKFIDEALKLPVKGA